VKADMPSRLERHFGHPIGQKYDDAKETDSYLQCVVGSRPPSHHPDQEECNRPQHVDVSRRTIICIGYSVNIRDSELLAFRLLFQTLRTDYEMYHGRGIAGLPRV
jgi:hypothetical protein